MKILYVTTVGLTMGFFKFFIKELINEGNSVDIATNEMEYKVADCYHEWGCKIHPISCIRLPLRSENLKAIREIKQIVQDGRYDLVHCHTPIASACTRLACRSLRKNGLKVIYTAHGFHFYKGAPLKNWLIYYPIEKLCAHWTDVLITINTEDYELAKKKFRAKRVEYVPSVGIDVDKFKNTVIDKNEKRKELGIPADSFVILSVGELNENKNHQVIIKALGEISDSKIHYVIAGSGNKTAELQTLADSLSVNLHLLGHRDDVAELYKMADVYILPSIREGLNVSIMEALASELPVICSDIRGNRDLIVDEKGGFLCDSHDSKQFCEKIMLLAKDRKLCEQQGQFNKEYVEKFSKDNVIPQVLAVYESLN